MVAAEQFLMGMTSLGLLLIHSQGHKNCIRIIA